MDHKRNLLGNNHHIKNSNLMQPLIVISKASTPIRTRVVTGASPINQASINSSPINHHNNNGLNSTPVNSNKLFAMHRSPNNKENNNSNQYKQENPLKKYTQTMPNEPQNRINLSPILALNRKMKEVPEVKKQLMSNTHFQKRNVEYHKQESQKNYQTLVQSKNKSSFMNTTSFANLRGSNSFKDLIESRSKTPNRFQNNQSAYYSNKQNEINIKNSLSGQNLNLFKQSRKNPLLESRKSALIESRSIDHSPQKGNDIKCRNNDGKKAKYRVNQDVTDEEGQHYYYCSKCTIPLVQQGFNVEQIGKQSSFQKNNNFDQKNQLQNYMIKLKAKNQQLLQIIDLYNRQAQPQIQQIDLYYNSIIEHLEQQKNLHKERIEKFYHQKKQQPQNVLAHVEQCIELIENSLQKQNYLSKIKFQEVQNLLSYSEPIFTSKPKRMNLNIEQSIDLFIREFEETLKPNFDIGTITPVQNVQNRNHAMRFSFQKLLNDIHTKKSKTHCLMKPLVEQDEQEGDNELLIEPNQEAFRNLFPDEQEVTHLGSDIHSPTFKQF